MPHRQNNKSLAPVLVERFIKHLNITYKAVKLYPLSSNIPRDNAKATIEILRRIMIESHDVRFEVTKDGLLYEGAPVYPGQPAFLAFAREFYSRNLAQVRFHPGVTYEELLRFLSVLDIPLPELASSGGFEARLWEHSVNGVSVREAAARIVETAGTAADEEWPPEPSAIDEILGEASGRHPRAQRLLARLIADPDSLDSYIAAGDEQGGVDRSPLARARLALLARTVHAQPANERGAMHEALADLLRRCDPRLRRNLLSDLVECGRHEEALADLIRAMPLEEVCAGLLVGSAFGEHDRDEVVRAVRGMVSLGVSPRKETLAAVAGALDEAGAPADFRAAVLEEVAPTRLRVSERPTPEERPSDVVLRLLDAVSADVTDQPVSDDGSDLAAEAARGISDADVFGALVTMVSLEERPERFETIMSMLENNLGLLIERQDFAVAADAAEALVQAEKREGLADAQRQRLEDALGELARPQQVHTLTTAMRLYSCDSAEHEACERLLRLLGARGVASLLEVLAEEKSMANRKALVDVISTLAGGFIPALGDRLSDPRWYFVRNVVGILGATHEPEALTYLERTIRHHDTRVRRETLRSVAKIRDAMSGELLIAALDDSDAGNVQLAARYLASMRVSNAARALEEVARGDGRGNRDVEARIEAIEALGKIGGEDSLQVLDALAHQRAIRASRVRDVKAAASSAAAAIRARGGAA